MMRLIVYSLIQQTSSLFLILQGRRAGCRPIGLVLFWQPVHWRVRWIYSLTPDYPGLEDCWTPGRWWLYLATRLSAKPVSPGGVVIGGAGGGWYQIFGMTTSLLCFIYYKMHVQDIPLWMHTYGNLPWGLHIYIFSVLVYLIDDCHWTAYFRQGFTVFTKIWMTCCACMTIVKIKIFCVRVLLYAFHWVCPHA